MLHIETVESGAFYVLKQLMAIPELKGLSLVGGTALSLFFGHRMSVDHNLFSIKQFENTAIINAQKKSFRINLLWKKKLRIMVFFVLYMM
jgi:hypothetical protein